MHDTLKKHAARKIDMPEAPWVCWLYRGIVVIPGWDVLADHPESVEFLFHSDVCGANTLAEAQELIDQLIADEADED